MSRYHFFYLLKFFLWLTIGAIIGRSLSRIYIQAQGVSPSRQLCDEVVYWPRLAVKPDRQDHKIFRKYFVQILVLHVGVQSQPILNHRLKIWQKMADIKNTLHFVDQDLFPLKTQLQNLDWMVPITGFHNLTFIERFKMIIYQFLTSSKLRHEFYCFVTDNVLFDPQRRFWRLVDALSLLKPVSTEKEFNKEQLEKLGCVLVSNCSLADGLILSRTTLENSLSFIRTCTPSKEFAPLWNHQSRFNECITGSTLFKCIKSPKIHQIFYYEVECNSTDPQFLKDVPTSRKSSQFFTKLLEIKTNQIDLLQQRSMRLSIEFSALINLIDFVHHNQSLVDHQTKAYRQWSVSRSLPQNLPIIDPMETSPWHYTNDRYIYTTHNLHKSPTQKLSVGNSSWTLQASWNVLSTSWKILDYHLSGFRFRYSYRHVSPVLGVRHLIRIGATLHSKYTNPKQRSCNVTFYTSQKYHWPPLTNIEDLKGSYQDDESKHISLIVPVAGRHKAFVRFLKTLSLILVHETNIDITFIVFKIGSDRLTQSKIQSLRTQNPKIKIRAIILRDLFARANALQIGVSHTEKGVILLFVDVDMIFTNSFLQRVRLNTILGEQAYFPMYFSQYGSASKCEPQQNCSPFSFKFSNGLWRYFGFGMASLYREDFLRIGGYDLTIKGWGQEDIKFYESALQNLSVFRAPDPGLVHTYHNKSCSQHLTPHQYKMCLGSKFNIFNHQRILANIIYNNLNILNRCVG